LPKKESKKMTVEEYAKLHNITSQATLYRIKKGKIKAKKNQKGNWEILPDKKEDFEQKESYHDRDKLLQEIDYLKQQVKDKEMVIEAERRSNIALLSTVESYKLVQKNDDDKTEKKGFFARLFTQKNTRK
jgi:hypothetical protein